MKIGCCISLADVTKSDKISVLRRLGYDYAELPLSQIADLSDEDFKRLLTKINELPSEACNLFYPPSVRLTGADVNMKTVHDYTRRAVKRASELGAEIIVLGSGGAKNIPEGFPHDKAKEQFMAILQSINEIAAAYGITIVLEPLNTNESNFITTVTEGLEIVREAGCANIQLLADYYHMRMENESLNVIAEAKEHLRHVHIAAKEGRAFPKDGDGEDYKSLFDALKATGYTGRVSIEGSTRNFEDDARAAVLIFKRYAG